MHSYICSKAPKTEIGVLHIKQLEEDQQLLGKRLKTTEDELDQAQEKLRGASESLEAADKKACDVRHL